MFDDDGVLKFFFGGSDDYNDDESISKHYKIPTK